MRIRLAAFLVLAMAPLAGVAAPAFSFLELPPPGDSTPVDPLNRAYAALNQQRLDVAEQQFQRAAEADPRNPKPYLGLADVARLRNDLAGVERWVRKAYEVAPGSLDAALAMGRLMRLKQDPQGAERYFREAIATAPQAVRPQLDIGELYQTLPGRQAQAAEAFRKAAALDPQHAGARFGLGMALLAGGDAAGAVAAINEAIRLAPNNPLAFYGLGQAEAARGDYTAAVKAFDRAVALQPSLAAAIVLGAEARLASGDRKGAAQAIDRAAAQDPRNPVLLLKQGMIHHAAGDAAGAYAAYLEAIKADPQLAVAFNNLAALAADRKERLDEAMGWARQAVALEPDRPEFQDTLAAVQRARGERPAADPKAPAAREPDPKKK